MFKLYTRVANHHNHPSIHGAARPWQHLRKQEGGDGKVEEPPETARSGQEEQPAPGTTFTNSQTQPHNPKPQNLQHKSMRPWQHLRKQESRKAATAKLRSHLRQPEAEKKSNQRKAPRSQTAKPNPTMGPTTRNPRNLQHKSMRPWRHLRKQEGGDGEVEEPPETARSGQEEQPAQGTTFTNSQTQPHNPKPQNLQHKSMRPWQHLRKQEGRKAATAKLRSDLRQPEADKKSNQRQAPRSQTAKPNPTTRNPRTYSTKA